VDYKKAMRKSEQRWCPNGDGAFDPWVVRCPRCGERLVDRPPERALDNSPVRVAIAPNQAIAELWKSALDGEGIIAMLRPLGPGFGAWASVATFEHEILVRGADVARARSILDEWSG
jgi:hypothetical protein